MGRWQPEARERLERAALELFTEQGFNETTVPHITARAGLTTRTFFRHFADKREVLFVDEDEVPAQVTRLMAGAPQSLSPMALIVQGLPTYAVTRFEGRREHLRARRAVIQADEGLRERELRKLADLSAAIERGFRDRGVDQVTSALAAQLGVTAMNLSLGRWLDSDGERPLAQVVLDTLAAFRSLATDLEATLREAPPAAPVALSTDG